MSEEIEPGLGLSDASGGLAALSRGASFFMKATGADQGPIEGNSTTKGQKGKIELMGIEESLLSPRDIASGLPTGRRVHHPLHVAFKLDKSGPKWFTAIDKNETLKSVEIDCWSGISKGSGIGDGSGYKLIYKIELANANVSEIQHFTAVNGELCMKLGFTFEKITLTWADGGIEGTDNWLSPTT
jgi:type VI secretion system secreted protein Hcp